jgi:K+ transporter
MPLSSLFYFFFIKKEKLEKNWINLMIEISIWCLPFIIISSFFMDFVNETYFVIYTFCAVFLFLNYKNGRIKFLSDKRLKELNSKKKYFISMYRSYVSVKFLNFLVF